jgi:RecA/RadA recombinase
MEDNRRKALEAALGQIEKQFGKGAVMRMTGADAQKDVEVISTGSLTLDMALGVGGLPRGRIIEIYGPESSGKTTLTLHAVAECQKAGGVAAFIDAEHALDVNYAAKLGVNIEELLVSQPDTGEQALEIADMLVRSNAVDIIVVDSVAALVPKAEIEGEMGDSHVGLHARLMSQALRKLTGNISRSKCMVIFINQIRMKIGVMYGSPETTTGGNALGAPRHPPHRQHQEGRRGRRQRDPGQDRQEQARAAVPRSGVRDPLQRGHLQARRTDRHRRRAQAGGEVRRLVCLQRRQDRPGQGQRARVPQGAAGDRRGARGRHP